MLSVLIATHLFYPATAALPRYDVITLAALTIQCAMLLFRLETWEEARVILVFHLVGTGMELFKTAIGSWIYPEFAYLRLGGVPLFSGFMYAAVGSYIARVWRIFDLAYEPPPPPWALAALAGAIYVNFFTHHWLIDIRLGLFAAAIILFGRTSVGFTPHRTRRRMPLLLGFFLVALFIWLAENVGTYTNAWIYPDQRSAWTPVGVGKLGAWYLLIIISFALVTLVHRAPRPASTRASLPAR